MSTLYEQLQAMRELAENWDGYGAASPQAFAIDLAQKFVALLDAVLRKSASGPATLHVSPTRIGGVLIDWEDPSMQHEVEINPDGALGFLHLHKVNGQHASSRTHVLTEGSSRNCDKLSL